MTQRNFYETDSQTWRNGLTDMDNKLVLTKGKREVGRDKLGVWD